MCDSAGCQQLRLECCRQEDPCLSSGRRTAASLDSRPLLLLLYGNRAHCARLPLLYVLNLLLLLWMRLLLPLLL
jgi:hypothetical protein